MSFLGKALSVVGAVVGIAAAVASGGTLAILAAAVLTVGAASRLGLIGGSIGKFMNSGWGTALLAAAALGSAGAAMYGEGAGQAGLNEANLAATQATAEGQAGAAASAQAGADASTIASDSTAIATDSSFSQAVGTVGDNASLAASNPELAMSTSGVTPQALSQANAASDAAGNTNVIGAQGSQAAEQNLEATQKAANGGDAALGAGKFTQQAPIDSGASGAAAPDASAAGAGEGMGLKEGFNATPETEGGAASSGNGGMLGKAIGLIDKHPGVAEIAGKTIGGFGEGIMQKQSVQEQLKAQEWGNQQWNDPAQLAQLQHAAATPVTVPQGYLQRAQQVRSMMGSTIGPQPGPMPVPAVPGPVQTH